MNEVAPSAGTSRKVLSYIFAVLFGITGVIGLATGTWACVFLILAALALLPQTAAFIKAKSGHALTGKPKGILIASLLVIFVILLPSSDTPATSTVAPSQQTNTQASAEPKTPEENLKSTLSGNVTRGGSFSYIDTEFEGADPDRPAGSKMITVKVQVGDFFNRNSLLRHSGNLSGKMFQSIYGSDINAADALVWFYGETTDRYGNKKNDVILVYGMDKVTYEKINWSGFDTDDLCDFLQREERISGIGTGPACNILVNIQ